MWSFERCLLLLLINCLLLKYSLSNIANQQDMIFQFQLEKKRRICTIKLDTCISVEQRHKYFLLVFAFNNSNKFK